MDGGLISERDEQAIAGDVLLTTARGELEHVPIGFGDTAGKHEPIRIANVQDIACGKIAIDGLDADRQQRSAGVVIHGDERVRGVAFAGEFVDATEEDWGREYLALEISVKVVGGIDEAIARVNRYGTGHSEAIVAEDEGACERFLREVDAAAVYANASTRFTDGGEFGLGAEIGISTQKLHARGPFAAEALTTYKYELRGTGQVRP